MTALKFTLGQRVRVTREYSRMEQQIIKEGERAVLYKKKWKSIEVKPYEGIIVGVRSIQDGTVQYGIGDTVRTWTPVHYKQAYMVARDMNRKPALVPPYAIEDDDLFFRI